MISASKKNFKVFVEWHASAQSVDLG